jgi:hypothetical protein
MASIINVDKIAEATNGSGVQIPGHVIQVLQFVYPTYQGVTASSYAATGITKAITPASSSSKILVNMTVTAGNSGSNAGENAFALYRSIGGGTASSIETFERAVFAYDPGGASIHIDASIALSFLDSPNTTSATTYTLYARTNTGTLRINDHQSSGYGQSTITLMEIAQ